MTKTFFSIAILTSICLAQSPSPPAPLPQIQSRSLRIEFDKQMRSRVVARFNGKEVPLGAFSASETVKGSERAWYDLCLGVAEAGARQRRLWWRREAHSDWYVWKSTQDFVHHHLRRLPQSCSIRCQLHEYWQVAAEDSRMEQQ